MSIEDMTDIESRPLPNPSVNLFENNTFRNMGETFIPDGPNRLWIPGANAKEVAFALLEVREIIQGHKYPITIISNEFRERKMKQYKIWVHNKGFKYVNKDNEVMAEVLFTKKDDAVAVGDRIEGNWKIFTNAHGDEVRREFYFPEAKQRRVDAGKDPDNFDDEEKKLLVTSENSDPEPGVESVPKVAGGANTIPAPDADRVESPESARDWLNEVLDFREVNRLKFSETDLESLWGHIGNLKFEKLDYMPLAAQMLVSEEIANTPVLQHLTDQQKEARILNKIQEIRGLALDQKEALRNRVIEEERTKLLISARSRALFLNADILASLDAGSFPNYFAELHPLENKEILSIPGVETVIEQLEANNGSYFRKRFLAPQVITLPGGRTVNQGDSIENEALAKAVLREYLKSTKGLSDLEADRAIRLGLESMQIFGRGAYYDGILLKDNVQLRDSQGNIIQINPDDPFVSAEVLKQLYPNEENILRQLARFTVDHWDQIDIKRSNSGYGAGNLRRLFYFQLWLAKNPDQGGIADELKRWVSLYNLDLWWHNNGGYYGDKLVPDPNDPTEKIYVYKPDSDDPTKMVREQEFRPYSGLKELMLRGDDMIGWSFRIAAAHKARETFYNGKDAVLNNPLLEPRLISEYRYDLRTLNEKVFPNVLKNLLNAEKGYAFLAYRSHQPHTVDMEDAMAHLTEGVLWYANTQAAKEEFHWSGLSQLDQSAVVAFLADHHVISRENAREVGEYLELSTLLIVLQILAPALLAAVLAAGGGTASAILKTR